MLNFLYRVAPLLYRLRLLIVACGVAAVGWFVYALFSADPAFEQHLLPATLIVAWSASLYGMGSGFLTRPAGLHTSDGWWLKLKKRLALGLARLWAAAFVLTSLGLLYLTVRTVSLIWRG